MNLQLVTLAEHLFDWQHPPRNGKMGPYLWEWWSDSSGHSPAAADKKPLPVGGLAPILRGSGWALTSAAHCGPTYCSRWNHPADQGGKHQGSHSDLRLTDLSLSLNWSSWHINQTRFTLGREGWFFKKNQPKSLFLQNKGDNTRSPRQKQKRHWQNATPTHD